MKKNKPFGELFSHSLKKILLTMRIAVILMILGILQARANDAYSQKTRLSLNFSDARLASVLDKIEDESEFFFLYNEKLLDTERKVDIKVNDQLINTVLDDLFTGTDVKYTIVDRKIILAPNYLTEGALPQQNKITGIVTDKNGPVAGVNVVVTGTTLGTQSDNEGKFSIDVPSGSKSLTFSFIGMQSQEIALGTSTKINVTMVESAVGLNEVVVTAMGIEKNTKALSYSVQKIEGLKMSAVPQTNFVNALAGRSAGVTVTSSGSGIGGSVKVVMRGNKFISGSNQPLYVVDGVPLLNRVRGGGGNTFGWSADEGDGVSNINPNDIESISVLKGASGAALYGSQAANGVIVITTKKGKAGFSEINISSSFTTDKPAYIPELQNKYGQTNTGSQFSWGGVTTTAHDNVSDFFRTGLTLINSVSFSTGTDKAQTYLSYANTDAKGLFKYNDITKHNFTIRQSERFFNNKLKIDFSVNYMQQKFLNSPSLGLYNVLTYLYEIPRGLDISDYKANPAVWDPVRKLYVQNWWEAPSVQSSYNPYWLIKYNKHDYNSKRTMLKFAAKYDITNSLSFQIRGNMDYTGDNTESKGYAGASSQVETNNGSYSLSNETFTEY
jgi:TonB-linked SusC/RagA family outer membrane protein